MKKELTPTQNKRVDTENPLQKTGEIVEKNSELYFRASVQDYYIKFCESSITKEDLKPYINKVINVEAEIIKGYFDTCPSEQVSNENREGYYIVINKILN